MDSPISKIVRFLTKHLEQLNLSVLILMLDLFVNIMKTG